MCKLMILFTIIFSLRCIYSLVETDFENVTVEDEPIKLLENDSNSDALHLHAGLKTNPETGWEYNEMIKPSPELESYTEKSNLEWISGPLREGLANFRVKSKTNQECNFQSKLYDLHLKNGTLWAVRMAESSQSEPIGILGGTTYQMGNFEECIKTKAYGVRGKYCLANFKYSLSPKYRRKYIEMVVKNELEDINQEDSVWEGIIKFEKDPAKSSRQDLYWGICLPATCSSQDLEYSLNQSLLQRFQQHNLELNITVDPIFCHTKDRLPFSTGFWITITFMFLLLLANVLSTVLDGYEYLQSRYHNKIEGRRKFIGTFSLWRNTYNLGIYNKTFQVKIVNIMKVSMMILIIYGHSLIYILGNPQFNSATWEEMIHKGADVTLANTGVVDVFFAMSGFLTFYYGYHPMKNIGIVILALKIFFRYLRLMPVFSIIMAYVAFVLPYTSNGPIWNARTMVESENCRNNWWLNILLLNNFYNVDEQCVVISWYITNDILLCIMGSILLFIEVKKPKVGICLSILILLLSIVVTFLVAYVNRYNGLLKIGIRLLVNHRKSMEYKDLYIALYSRIGPYLVGFLTGYLTIKLREKKFSFSMKSVFIGSVLAFVIGEGSQLYGILFYQAKRPYYVVENALYACLHRIIFAGHTSWFLTAYITSSFGILNSIINHRIFAILGRLTYSVFLVNTLSLFTLTASTRTPVFYSYKTLVMLVSGDIITNYVVGFLLYLYAEAPICGLSQLLQKFIFEKSAKQTSKTKSDTEEGEISEIKTNDQRS